MTPTEELFDELDRFIVRAFHLLGYIQPTWLAQGQSGQKFTLTTLFTTPEQKLEVRDRVRSLFVKHEIERYAFAAEAWAVSRPASNVLVVPEGGLKDVPGRQEVITLSGEDRSNTVLAGQR